MARPPLARGVNVGRYCISSLLGRGGMGEVYRAHDTHLKRDVALKLLRGEEAQEIKRVRRFDREAKAASALNHPGIVSIFDTGEERVGVDEAATPYIAMELVVGDSLAEMLRGSRLSVERILELAAPIAEALAAAHEAGIVHRDMKPSNILITRDGHPKLVDFGLAKQAPDPAAGEDDEDAETDTLTSSGEVLGTAGYMSPEQARGEPAEPASDQFSFGCILYEMLTGKRAFKARSYAETISSILRDEPATIESLAPKVPLPVRWIVTRCLAKTPQERYASTIDLARDLRTVRASYSVLALTAAEPARRWIHAIGLGIAGVALAMAAGAWFARRAANALPEPQFRPLTFRSGFVSRALFVPNSNAILYTASWEGQPLRTYQTLPNSVGLDRSLDAETHLPLAYSEDGTQVLVLQGTALSATVLQGTLAWWPSLGGRARPILEAAGWADWAPRTQRLAVVRDTGVARVLELRDPRGGLIRPLFETAGAISSVRFSPDEARVAFGHHPSRWASRGEVWTATVEGTTAHAVMPAFEQCRGLDWNPTTGEIWFAGSRTSAASNGIWAVGPGRGVRLVLALPNAFVLHDVSADGKRLLLERDRREAHLEVRRGRERPRTLNWFGWSVVSDLSPDGRSVLFYDRGGGEGTTGTWLRPLEGGDAIRLGEGVSGVFSPDGRSVVMVVSEGSQPPQLVLLAVGPGQRRRLTSPPGAAESPSFAGPTTVLFVRTEGTRSRIWRIETDGTGARPLGAADCGSPAASPAGDRFACAGGEDRRRVEVHDMRGGPPGPVNERREGGRIIQLSWDDRGKHVFAVTQDRRLFSVDAVTGTLHSEELLPYPGAGPYDTLIGAALNADASLQAYSVRRHFSDLFEVSGIR